METECSLPLFTKAKFHIDVIPHLRVGLTSGLGFADKNCILISYVPHPLFSSFIVLDMMDVIIIGEEYKFYFTVKMKMVFTFKYDY
jgi:hypothetical protein